MTDHQFPASQELAEPLYPWTLTGSFLFERHLKILMQGKSQLRKSIALLLSAGLFLLMKS